MKKYLLSILFLTLCSCSPSENEDDANLIDRTDFYLEIKAPYEYAKIADSENNGKEYYYIRFEYLALKPDDNSSYVGINVGISHPLYLPTIGYDSNNLREIGDSRDTYLIFFDPSNNPDAGWSKNSNDWKKAQIYYDLYLGCPDDRRLQMFADNVNRRIISNVINWDCID